MWYLRNRCERSWPSTNVPETVRDTGALVAAATGRVRPVGWLRIRRAHVDVPKRIERRVASVEREVWR